MFERALNDHDFKVNHLDKHLKNTAAKKTKKKDLYRMDPYDYLLATNMEFAAKHDAGLSKDIEYMPIA